MDWHFWITTIISFAALTAAIAYPIYNEWIKPKLLTKVKVNLIQHDINENEFHTYLFYFYTENLANLEYNHDYLNMYDYFDLDEFSFSRHYFQDYKKKTRILLTPLNSILDKVYREYFVVAHFNNNPKPQIKPIKINNWQLKIYAKKELLDYIIIPLIINFSNGKAMHGIFSLHEQKWIYYSMRVPSKKFISNLKKSPTIR